MKDLSYEAYSMLAKALSNKTRIRIIEELMEKELSVNEIVEKTGFEQSRVSHNLKCLLNCMFVERKKNGKENIYFIRKDAKPLLKNILKYAKKYENYLKSCEVVKDEL